MTVRLTLIITALLAATPDRPTPHVEGGHLAFVARGSLGLRIEGKTAELSAESTPEAVVFVVPLATLDTGIALRDRHMRDEYLQVQAYPLARLRISRDKLPSASATQKGAVSGELTLHGQTHPVNVTFEISPSSGYEVRASMMLDMRQYGIPEPKYLGVSVKPEVEVSADFHLDAP
jgi:polyisoprenoid-binding protein YceI